MHEVECLSLINTRPCTRKKILIAVGNEHFRIKGFSRNPIGWASSAPRCRSSIFVHVNFFVFHNTTVSGCFHPKRVNIKEAIVVLTRFIEFSEPFRSFRGKRFHRLAPLQEQTNRRNEFSLDPFVDSTIRVYNEYGSTINKFWYRSIKYEKTSSKGRALSALYKRQVQLKKRNTVSLVYTATRANDVTHPFLIATARLQV